MRTVGSAIAGVALVLGVVGCGDSGHPGEGSASGEGGAGAGASGGAGGMGGAAVGCEDGSHDAGGGVCDATLGAFTETAPISHARDHHVTWAATRAGGTFLYVAGGALDMMTAVAAVERSAILEDGTLSPWETLPGAFQAAGPFVVSTDARVLVGGGIRPSGTSNLTESAAIGDDGALGSFEVAPSLGVARFHAAAVLHEGWAYVSGGLDGTGTSLASIERIRFDDAGTSGEWITEAEQMPERRSHHGLAVHEGALYVTGGLTRENNRFNQDIAYDTVLRAEIHDDGSIGAWAVVGTLPRKLSVHSSFTHVDHLYVAHGLELEPTAFVSTFRRAPIGDDGSIGAWEELATKLPISRGHCHQTPMVAGRLYSVAGTNNGGSQTQCFVATFE